MIVLASHTSKDTAFVQDDYPWGFSKRCKRLVWVETNTKRGMRFVSQTINPVNGEPSAVKADTFCALLAAFVVEHADVGSKYPYDYSHMTIETEDIGHILISKIHLGVKPETTKEFVNLFGTSLLSDYCVKTIIRLGG